MSEEFETPRSRVEAILQNMLGAENVLPPPQSRIEYYLLKILEEGIGGGLPDVTIEDAGKFLRVSTEGVWDAEIVPSAENQSF